MAKIKSLFEVRGDVGDAGFRRVDGKGFLGRTSSIDKDRIMNDPKFKRTRENMAEFSASALAARSLRLGLAEVYKRYADKRVGSRLNKLFRKMLQSGPGMRGQRSIELQANIGQLMGLELHVSESLMGAFTAPRILGTNANRNVVTLDVPVFSPDAHVTAPNGATHYRIVLACASLSDIVWSAADERHVPANELLNGIGAVAYSAEMPIGVAPAAPITLTVALPGAPTLGATEVLLGLVGIEFIQIVNADYYLLEEANAMRVEAGF
jgi:hypothetical protein